jgi:DNA polymerase III gamma/tau subunit
MDNYGNKVHFIATCTVSTKLIENMHSRFMFYKLPPFTPEFLAQLFVDVAADERLKYDPACVGVLVERNQGIRSLVNTLEKLLLLDRFVDRALIDSTCTIIHNDLFEDFTRHILNGRTVQAMHAINRIHRDGYSVMDIFDCYFSFLKLTQLVSAENKFNYIKVLCKYITILNTLHEHPIELCFFVVDLVSSNLK